MPVNLKQSMNSSRSFYLAFQRCMEQRPLPNGQVQLVVVPAVVCAAFSIELGFKAIALRSGGSVSGHKLNELFKALEPSSQQAIIAAVGFEREKFDSSLEAVSSAFVEWRYIHERESANIDMEFLLKLSKATQDAI